MFCFIYGILLWSLVAQALSSNMWPNCYDLLTTVEGKFLRHTYYHPEVTLQECLNLECDELNDSQDRKQCLELEELDIEPLDFLERDIEYTSQIDQDALVHRSFRFTSVDLSIGDDSQLNDWKPVRKYISQNETHYYEFPINNTNPGISSSFDALIFITGNICSLPDTDLDENGLSLYYTFNQSVFSIETIDQMTKLDFRLGYVQALASNPTSAPFSTLYVAMQPNDVGTNTVSGQWTYELGISQNGLVFQWDDRAWAHLLDADGESALLMTGALDTDLYSNISDIDPGLTDSYSLHLFDYSYKSTFQNLNRSWCAIKSGPELSSISINTSFVQKNESIKEQFYVQNLNSSSQYIAYLTQNSGNQNSDSGGTVFHQFEFETMLEDTCTLIYDLEFCNNVDYAVPMSMQFFDGLISATELGALYDDYAKEHYENFTKSLQIVQCDTDASSRYSPLRTCQDCANSYQNWLCSVLIPRCTTRNNTSGYKYRTTSDGRNSFINEEIQPPNPYYEILPCVDSCNAIVRDCPGSFGFACPTTNETIRESYYWDEGEDYVSCNALGFIVQSSGARLSVKRNLEVVIALWIIIIYKLL
ncbi:hypothetical protein LJB42_001378 [Komagataella kurtzmanii]|nr:hypothetical protein LJB42_001378 [Komagataella kurtzmanii]